MKKGRISKEEHTIIEKDIKHMSVEEIAQKLNRNPLSVEEYIKRNFKMHSNKEEVLAYDLEKRPFWYEIKTQFTDEELKLFKYHWTKIIAQFSSDVLPTEELQIIDVIKVEILMNRSLRSNKENIEQINTLLIQAKEYEDSIVPEDMERYADINRQIAVFRNSQESLNKDYRDLLDKKAKMLKDMKGTREQRIKRLEDAKDSFPSWVASLLEDPERLRKYGIEMEKMRLAMENEKSRLSNYHKYEDGSIDQPFLNHESILLEEK